MVLPLPIPWPAPPVVWDYSYSSAHQLPSAQAGNEMVAVE